MNMGNRKKWKWKRSLSILMTLAIIFNTIMGNGMPSVMRDSVVLTAHAEGEDPEEETQEVEEESEAAEEADDTENAEEADGAENAEEADDAENTEDTEGTEDTEVVGEGTDDEGEVVGGNAEALEELKKTDFTSRDYTPENTQFNVGTVNLDTIKKVVDYCYLYKTDNTFGAAHQNDNISMSLTYSEGDTNLTADYVGLGSESYPFNGTVTFAGSSVQPFSLPRAFFGYVYDNVILYGNGNNTNIVLQLTRNGSVGSD